jgi:hypothetical protein
MVRAQNWGDDLIELTVKSVLWLSESKWGNILERVTLTLSGQWAAEIFQFFLVRSYGNTSSQAEYDAMLCEAGIVTNL